MMARERNGMTVWANYCAECMIKSCAPGFLVCGNCLTMTGLLALTGYPKECAGA